VEVVVARMANNCSARAPRSSHRMAAQKSDFCAKCSCAKMTVKSCGSHFVMIFTFHASFKACATAVFIGATLFNTETLHQREFEVPLNKLSVLGKFFKWL